MRMRSRSRGWMAFLVVLMLMVGSVALLSSATKTPFSSMEKASFASQATLNFVRPGLVMKIISDQINADATLTVTFSLQDPKGVNMDRLGLTTPGAVSTSFILAYLPANASPAYYVPLTLRSNTASNNGVTVMQPGADTGGTYAVLADGTYTYTFAKPLPTQKIPPGSTLTVGAYASRNLTEFNLGTNYSNTTFSFLWGGTGGKPAVREVITTATCNDCHSQIAFHGGSRRTMELCILCHVPGYINPNTGNSIDLKVMAHKIHSGAVLPSVIAGTPYQINGSHGNNDYSDIKFPAGTNNCVACHQPDAKQANAFLTRPSSAACGACHDDVNFATGVNHVNLPVKDDQCAQCHLPVGESDFDASIAGAHVNPNMSSLLPGMVGQITSVTNTAAGQKPTVTFTLKDSSGTTIPMSYFTGATAKPLYRIGLVLAGPTTDYVGITKSSTGAAVNGYVSEDPSKTATLNGDTYTYTFATAIPAGAKGSFTIGMEGRRNDTVLAGTTKQRTIEYGMKNSVLSFSVDGSPVAPRRTVVVLANCNKCHFNLSLHGENRNQIEQCVLCHNPIENDGSRRPASANPTESVDFALMIHRIHSGPLQSRDFTIYGFGGSKNNFNDVGYPGILNDCQQCHVAGSYLLPIKAVASINDNRGYINPVAPTSGACLGCHASIDAAAHVASQTSSSLGESCIVCHGENGEFAVSKVHATN